MMRTSVPVLWMVSGSIAAAAAAPVFAQVQSRTLYEWPAGSDFIPNPYIIDPDTSVGTGGVEIADFPLEGEVVDTRIELTLDNVPADWSGFPLDAAHIYVRVVLNGNDPALPFIFQKFVTADGFTSDPDGLSLGFGGTGGPMTASVSHGGLNGDVVANFWRVEWGTNEWPDQPANYGPVSGRVIVDYIADAAACACERTGDDPGSVDVFDLLAYLDDWFASAAAADIDGQPGVDVFDLLAYLDCWFAGC